jgi:hypothetical protein
VSTYLMVRGLDPIELDEDESFNRVRQKVNQAVTSTYRNGKDAARPLHEVTFFTADGGRIAPVPYLIQAVGSDQRKDGEEDED